MPQSVISEQTTQIPETLAKQGISGQIKEKQNYDKSTFRMPRQATRIWRIMRNYCRKMGQFAAAKNQHSYASYTFERTKITKM